VAPVATAEPDGMGVNVPKVGSIVKPDTVLSAELDTYRNCPLGSMAMPYGEVPTG